MSKDNCPNVRFMTPASIITMINKYLLSTNKNNVKLLNTLDKKLDQDLIGDTDVDNDDIRQALIASEFNEIKDENNVGCIDYLYQLKENYKDDKNLAKVISVLLTLMHKCIQNKTQSGGFGYPSSVQCFIAFINFIGDSFKGFGTFLQETLKSVEAMVIVAAIGFGSIATGVAEFIVGAICVFIFAWLIVCCALSVIDVLRLFFGYGGTNRVSNDAPPIIVANNYKNNFSVISDGNVVNNLDNQLNSFYDQIKHDKYPMDTVLHFRNILNLKNDIKLSDIEKDVKNKIITHVFDMVKSSFDIRDVHNSVDICISPDYKIEKVVIDYFLNDGNITVGDFSSEKKYNNFRVYLRAYNNKCYKDTVEVKLKPIKSDGGYFNRSRHCKNKRSRRKSRKGRKTRRRRQRKSKRT